jgi:hypothetical protein
MLERFNAENGGEPQRPAEKDFGALRAKRVMPFSAALCGSSPFSALKIHGSHCRTGPSRQTADLFASAGTGFARA